MAAAALRPAAARHPEAGAALVATGAWLLVLVPVAGGGAASAAHDAAHAAAAAPAAFVGWLTMVVAMMVPTALPVARYLALTSLWRRRGRTIALFLGAYVTVWAAFGAGVLPVLAVLDVDAAMLLPWVLLLAALWELTRAKWRGVRACRLVDPLPPRGREADRACLATGLRYGRRCVVACWPLMFAMAVAGHAAIGLMVLLSALVAAEKLAGEPSRLAPYGASVLGLAAVVATIGQAT